MSGDCTPRSPTVPHRYPGSGARPFPRSPPPEGGNGNGSHLANTQTVPLGGHSSHVEVADMHAPDPDPAREAGELLRELLREAHGVIKDLRRELKEAKVITADLAARHRADLESIAVQTGELVNQNLGEWVTSLATKCPLAMMCPSCGMALAVLATEGEPCKCPNCGKRFTTMFATMSPLGPPPDLETTLTKIEDSHPGHQEGDVSVCPCGTARVIECATCGNTPMYLTVRPGMWCEHAAEFVDSSHREWWGSRGEGRHFPHGWPVPWV